jgi:hypothetical protein
MVRLDLQSDIDEVKSSYITIKKIRNSVSFNLALRAHCLYKMALNQASFKQ